MPVDGTVLGSTPLLAIVRFPDGGDVVGAIEALVAGGVGRLEVTADTPGAFAAVEQAASQGRTVGVGTVLSGDQDDVDDDLRAGATAVALGSELVGRVAPRSDEELERIATNAARAVAAARASVGDALRAGEVGR